MAGYMGLSCSPSSRSSSVCRRSIQASSSTERADQWLPPMSRKQSCKGMSIGRSSRMFVSLHKARDLELGQPRTVVLATGTGAYINAAHLAQKALHRLPHITIRQRDGQESVQPDHPGTHAWGGKQLQLVVAQQPQPADARAATLRCLECTSPPHSLLECVQWDGVGSVAQGINTAPFAGGPLGKAESAIVTAPDGRPSFRNSFISPFGCPLQPLAPWLPTSVTCPMAPHFNTSATPLPDSLGPRLLPPDHHQRLSQGAVGLIQHPIQLLHVALVLHTNRRAGTKRPSQRGNACG